jgi:hypothetical protein
LFNTGRLDHIGQDPREVSEKALNKRGPAADAGWMGRTRNPGSP